MSVFKEQRLCHTMSSPLPPIIMLPPRLLDSSSNRMARLVLNRARVIVTVKRMVELAATCEGLLGPMGASLQAMASIVRSSVQTKSWTEQVAETSTMRPCGLTLAGAGKVHHP